MQVCFDPQFPIPTVAQVERAALKRFRLADGHRTAVAPVEKFMMLSFDSVDEARSAAQELPRLLRQELQKHTEYSIRTHTMSVKRGIDVVKDAAERRKARHRSAAPAAPAAVPAAAPAAEAARQVPMQQAAPMWPGHVMHAAPQVVYMQPAPVVPQAAVVMPPARAGFLHPVGQPPGAMAAPGYAADMGPAADVAVSPARQQVAPAQAPAAASTGHGLGSLGVDMAGILASVGSTAGAAAGTASTPAGAQSAGDAGSNMLSLLQQLGAGGAGT